jgi:signal transduction histidine kinase/CheY-like chemotaxis protein
MVSKKWYKKEAFNYFLYGASFGCAFPIFATIFDLLRLDKEINFTNIVAIQTSFPIHFIIDTAPFFLGLFALLGGIKQDAVLNKNIEITRISKEKEEFFANISHEIRTPMNGVIGIIDVLKRTTNLNEIQKKYLTVISKSSFDMMAIINDILDLSKLEAGELTVKYSTNSIKNVLQQEINLFTELADERQNTIELIVDNNIPEYLKLGEIRIKQIVRNLLSNAIKFTKNGKIKIRATLVESYSNNSSNKIKIEIIDNGVGIGLNNQKLLFNVFQQLDQSSTKKAKGTGLGLSIAKKLAVLMHGEIGIESEINKGSNFWFTFLAENSEAPTFKNKNKYPNNHLFKNKKILVVDDMEINILVATTMLEKLGFKVDVSKNGFNAIEKYKKKDYCLILMDIQMPKMDGIETTHHIRSIVKPTPPIIAFTANAMDGDKEKYIAQGLDDHISKPIVIDKLNSILEKWLSEKAIH